MNLNREPAQLVNSSANGRPVRYAGRQAAPGPASTPGLCYCTLTFRPSRGKNACSSRSQNVVLLAIKNAHRDIGIFVSPQILQTALGDDLLYIHDLLENLPRMAKRYPDLVFEQLSSMSAGPLITSQVGEFHADHPALPLMWANLVDLDVMRQSSSSSASY